MRCTTGLVAVLVVLAACRLAAAADKPRDAVDLFNGKGLAGWEHYLVDPNVSMADVWSVRDGLLICRGEPMGYLATTKADPERVYLTGLSMGGFGTWAWAAREPQRFAAAIPICGGGNPETAEKLVALPIWVFHGGKDNVVPLSRSEAMVKAIQQAGGRKVKLTAYPDAGHDAWTKTYDNPEIYKWLLSHTRAN